MSSSTQKSNAALMADWHGRVGLSKGWKPPKKVTECDAEARPGYNSCKAHEYVEDPAVLLSKVRVLAESIRKAQKCIAYTGAGISTASGIGDYASKAGIGKTLQKKKLLSPWDAQPTLSHRILVELYKGGFLHYWVQQNHDGLPEKAGMPCEMINSIHGDWYDPSNPVVPMNGSLRDDLFANLLEWENKADLVLALGTSLCGMNADRLVETANTSKRAMGAVIVSLQKTVHDSSCFLRIFAKLDDVFHLLAQEMLLEVPKALPYAPNVIRSSRFGGVDDIFEIPYDEKSGKLLSKRELTERGLTLLDLRRGAKLYITNGPFKNDTAVVTGKNREGHYKLRVSHPLKKGGALVPVVKVLGSWFTESLTRGRLDASPVISWYNKRTDDARLE